MSTGADQKPASGQQPASGLKSALKTAVPLLALGAVVFGVTFFGWNTDRPPDDTTKPEGTAADTSSGPPLVFFTSARRWDPPKANAPGYRNHPLLAPSGLARDEELAVTSSLSDRVFQGVYEPSQEHLRQTQFWFENRNPNSVSMQLKGLSCGACTGGRVAAIPPKVASDLLHHSGLAALPIGAFNPFGVGLTQPLASLALPPDKGGLQWTEYGFQADPNATFKVPAANPSTNKWEPQWGILELKFKVTNQPGAPPEPLKAVFATQVEGTSQAGGNQFIIGFDIAWPFMLSRSSLDVGRLDPLTGDRDYELIVYSATRGPGSEFGDLDTPTAVVNAPGGVTDPVKFIEVTKVERLPEADLPEVAERVAADLKRLTRVRSAYRMTVIVRPKVGETRMDIGQLERTLAITAGGVTAQLPVKGTVRGSVWLDGDATDVDTGTFVGAKEFVRRVDLVTEKTGIELAIVKDECQPSKFSYELTKQPDRGGRGYYQIKITVPPGQQFGSFKGVMVLEVKGPNPQRIRIPLKGTGTLN